MTSAKVILVFAAIFGMASCDYKCVCNYNVEKSVYSSASAQGNVIGYMYEFDCKPQAGLIADADWLQVAYEQKVGYIEKDSQLQIQTCPGAVPDEDKLPSTSVPNTTEAQTTMPQPTEAQTTMPQPTEAHTTMSQPTEAQTTVAQTTVVDTTTQNTATTQTTTLPTTSTSVVITTESTTVTQPSTTVPTTQAPTTRTVPTSTTAKTTMPSTQATTTTVAMTSTSTPLPISTTTTKTTSAPTTQSASTLPITATTPKPSILKGHVELCPNQVQQLAHSRGEFLAQFGQNCYEIVQSGVSWSHAESICKGHGGHLIHIANQQEQDFIFDVLVKNHMHTVWLGLNDRNTEEKFEWTSGDNVTYENWKLGRKDNRDHNYEDCVFMTPTTGEWDDVECGGNNVLSELIQGIRHSFICQYAVITPANTLIDGNLNMCPSRLHQQASRDNGILAQHDRSCYELVSNQKVAWVHAEQLCTSRGGHLVYISSAQEQSFVQSFMKSHYPDHAVWIGLTDRHTEGRFHWASGAYTHYTNWVPGHIANYASSSQEDCVVLIPYKNGQWDDIPCGYTSHPLFGHTHSSGETHPLLCEYTINTGPAIIG